jgi:multiple sugar transport system ATP-binding protein
MGFSLLMNGVPKSGIEAKVRPAAEILGLTNLLNRYPRQLSGGQRQRVAMGRAIVRNPQVFLFDEPLSNLDAKLRVQMRIEIKELHQRLKTTTVYVTHDQIEAMTMADKIVVMHDGIVEQIGAPLELYDRPNNLFVAGFIGSPAMNMIEGRISPSDQMLFVTQDGTTLPLPRPVDAPSGRALIYGLRPEHVRFDSNGIPASVVVTEPTGAETMVIARLGGNDVTLMFHERIHTTPGDTLRISINESAVHVFDKETGQRL